jgi:hypothetical protein
MTTATIRLRLRTARRLTSVLALDGFRASPGAMTVSLVSGLVAALAMVAYSIGYRLVIDGAVRGDRTTVLVGIGLTAALFTLTWTLSIVNAMRNGILTDRVNLRLGARIAELANTPEGLGHFEDPAYRDEIQLLRSNRRARRSPAPGDLDAAAAGAVRLHRRADRLDLPSGAAGAAAGGRADPGRPPGVAAAEAQRRGRRRRHPAAGRPVHPRHHRAARP